MPEVCIISITVDWDGEPRLGESVNERFLYCINGGLPANTNTKESTFLRAEQTQDKYSFCT